MLDVDGFHPVNIGRMVLGLPAFVPCTPAGVIEILRRAEIPLSGAAVTVIGRSQIVGRPLSVLLSQKGVDATVTLCHTRTKDLARHTRGADVVVVAAGRDELLPVFTGVRMEIEGDTLSLLATDRYRMALKELTWHPSSPSVEGAVLVPGKVLADTAKSMTSGETVTISLSTTEAEGEGLAGFVGQSSRSTREATTRLLSQAFPKVRHLMNVDPTVSVRVNTADLLAAVKRVSLVAERNTPLRMRINEDHITLEAATGDQAQASEALEAQVDVVGDEQSITDAGFNPHYLLDALTAVDAPFAHFSFTLPGKPCLIMGLASIDADPLADYRHVIMLMRLPVEASA